MTNAYKDQATTILVNQFSSYAKKLTDFSDRVYNVIVEKGPYYDDLMSGFQESDKCLDTLREFLNEQGYTFTQFQLECLAEELIYSGDGSHGIYPNLFRQCSDLLEESNIDIEGTEFMDAYIVLFDWSKGTGVCELSCYGDDEETGLLLNAKKEYETLRKDGVEKYISLLLSYTPEEYYEQIVNGELDYDGVLNKNPELKEDFITIQEIKENKNSEGKPLIDNRIPEVIEEAMKILSTEQKFSECSKLLLDYAKKNLNVVESELEKTKGK